MNNNLIERDEVVWEPRTGASTISLWGITLWTVNVDLRSKIMTGRLGEGMSLLHEGWHVLGQIELVRQQCLILLWRVTGCNLQNVGLW